MTARWPLTTCQERYYRTHTANGGPAAVQASFEIRGPLAVDALEEAVSATVGDLEALRLALDRSAHDGSCEPYQSLLPTSEAARVLKEHVIARSDVQFAAYASRRAAADGVVGWAQPRRPAAVMRLLRSRLDHHALLASFSHLFVDGTSKPLVMDRLWSHYAALVGDRDMAPRQPRRDFLAAITERTGGDRAATASHRAARFWTRCLEGFDLHASPPSREPRRSPASITTLSFSGPRLEPLRAGCAANGTTTFQTLAASIASAIFDSSDCERLVVDIPVDCRPAGEAATVGMFSRRLPLVLDRARSRHELMEQVYGRLLSLLLYRHVPPEVPLPSAAVLAERSLVPAVHLVLSHRMHRDSNERHVKGTTVVPNAYPATGIPVARSLDIRIDERADSLDITLASPRSQPEVLKLSTLSRRLSDGNR